MSVALWDAYLELVQLTQLFLLQNVRHDTPSLALSPVVKKTAPPAPPVEEKKALTPPLKIEAPSPKAEAPTAVLKKPQPIENDLRDIQELLKQHCPQLKLIDPPAPAPEVFILYAKETAQEKQLLQDLSQAVNKRGFSIELVAIEKCQPQQWVKSSTKVIVASRELVLETKSLHPLITRDASKALLLNQIPLLVIPDLSLLMKEPESKRALWQKLMALLMNGM